MTASTVATILMSPGVPPTSRSAANRSSRRSAASRVAVLISTSMGNSTASTPTPNAYRKNGVNTSDAGAVEMEVTHWVPGILPTCAGVCPMTMARSPAPLSPAWPIVPISLPGNRAPSSPAGTVRSSAASAGEA